MTDAGMLYEVARFRCGDDLRIMFVGRGEGGLQVLREDICGPSVEDAYGADAARLQVSIAPEGAAVLDRALLEVFNASGLRGFASNEDNDILDLMDLCDREGVAYTYTCVDTSGNMGVRPAGA